MSAGQRLSGGCSRNVHHACMLRPVWPSRFECICICHHHRQHDHVGGAANMVTPPTPATHWSEPADHEQLGGATTLFPSEAIAKGRPGQSNVGDTTDIGTPDLEQGRAGVAPSSTHTGPPERAPHSADSSNISGLHTGSAAQAPESASEAA